MHSRKQVLYREPNTIPKYLLVVVQFNWQKEASSAFFSKNQGKGTHVHILPSAMPVDDLTSFCRFILFGLASFCCDTTICKTPSTSCRCYVTSFLMHLHAHVFTTIKVSTLNESKGKELYNISPNSKFLQLISW